MLTPKSLATGDKTYRVMLVIERTPPAIRNIAPFPQAVPIQMRKSLSQKLKNDLKSMYPPIAVLRFGGNFEYK